MSSVLDAAGTPATPHPSPAAPSARVPSSSGDDRLGAGRIGVPALVCMIVAASAPLTAVAGGITSNFAVTGLLGVPLSFLVLGAVLLLFSVGYAAMSRHVHNAGAFFAYVARGMGKPAGVGAALVALVSYACMQVGIAGMFGFATSSFLEGTFGIAVPWWASALGAWVLVGVLGLYRVDFSAKVLMGVVALEFLVVCVYTVLGLRAAPEGVSAAGLLPDQLFASGVGAALVFSVAAFMGFESGAIYNEEVKDPKRTAGRATLISVVLIAVFYAFSAWAMVMTEGPGQVVAAAQAGGPDVVFAFLGAHTPLWFTDLANILFIVSLLAALLAFHNIVARYAFALGREHVLPAFLAHTSTRTGAPVGGSLAQSGAALVVLVVFAVAGSRSDDPLFPVVTLFTWLTNMGAFGLVLLMALTSVSVIGYLRRHRDEFGVFTRVVAPALAAVGLLALFVLTMVNFPVLLGADGPTPLSWLLPALVVAPGALGTAWALWLKARRPATYAGIARGGELS